MARHVIIGAGPVGTTTAHLLADQGHEVRLVSRRGLGPRRDGIVLVTADAADSASLARTTTGAAAIFNCANPPYHRWATDWPPIAASLLATAEATGAVLVTTGNLYGYGPVDHPMRESDELAARGTKGRVRAQMWWDALAAHEAGRARVTEARASDFFGPHVTDAHLGERVVPRVLRGRTVSVIGNPDVAHSWTYLPDLAATLVTLAADERAWGRPWHVPTNAPLTQRQAVAALARAASIDRVKVKALPGMLLTAVGVVSPALRELREVAYQFEQPFVLDSTVATATFGLTPTPYDQAFAATIAWYRDEAARQAA